MTACSSAGSGASAKPRTCRRAHRPSLSPQFPLGRGHGSVQLRIQDDRHHRVHSAPRPLDVRLLPGLPPAAKPRRRPSGPRGSERRRRSSRPGRLHGSPPGPSPAQRRAGPPAASAHRPPRSAALRGLTGRRPARDQGTAFTNFSLLGLRTGRRLCTPSTSSSPSSSSPLRPRRASRRGTCSGGAPEEA
jgi:hypothetical protein